MSNLGIAVKFICQYDPELNRKPTAFDGELVRRLRAAAFLRAAPDYDPALHDELIRKTVWGRP